MPPTIDHDDVARRAYLEAMRLGLRDEQERIAFCVVALLGADNGLTVESAIDIARAATRSVAADP